MYLLDMTESVDRHRQSMNQGVRSATLQIEKNARKPHGEEKAIDYVFELLDISWWYYAIAVLLGVVAWRVWKRPCLGMLVGYAVLLLAETVLIRKPFIGQHFQPELFWSWRAWNVQRGQIIANVIMFFPVGLLVGCIWGWRGILVAAGLSVGIEILQLITARGLCEFDDVIHNCSGAVVGVLTVKVVAFISKKEGCT
jgi:hypothetical protein